MRRFFIGPNGLRAGWRFLIFVIASMLLQTGIQFTIIRLGYKPSEGIAAGDFALADGIGLAAMLVVAAILARFEHRKLGSYGFPLRRAFGARWWEGLVWGVAAVAATMGLVIAAGGATIDGFAIHGRTLAMAAGMWLVTMVILGLYEEFLFRGYPQDALASGMGFWPAAILLSAIFGAIHYFTKPMENVTDAVAVALIGLFMAFSLRRTGDLWFAAGFHTAFDYVALNVLGAPNTGNGGKPLSDHFLATRFTGPEWITGGVRGLEASVFIFLVMGVLFVLLDRRFRAVPLLGPEEEDTAALAV